MKALNKCQVCGKTVRSSLLCRECEDEVLSQQKGSKIVLSSVLGIISLGVLYLFWLEYKANQSQINFRIVTGAFDTIQKGIISFINSAYVVIPLLLVLIIIAFIFGSKIFR